MAAPPCSEATIAICSCKTPPERTVEGPNCCRRFGAYCINSVTTTTPTSGVSMKFTDTGSRLGYINRGYVGGL